VVADTKPNPKAKAKAVYTGEDLKNFDAAAKLGQPGEFPFTRGIHPTMYRGRLWTMRQYAGFGAARESNERYRYLLSQGQTGLSIAFDLPTQIGLDSDDPLSAGEVGKVGVAIDSLEDMAVLLEAIPLEKVSVSMTINATAGILLAMVLALAEERGVPWNSLSGTIQNDILKEYVARGTYIFPPRPSLRLISDIVAFCEANVPKWNTMSISGYHIREAGANAVQELAFTFANALTYLETLIAAGLDVDAFAPRLSFFFAAHNDLFEEVAKFRAARRIWAGLVRDRFKAKTPASWMLRFHTQTSGSTLLAQQPENNVTRVTLQALAAVLGGTQSLHTNSWDEALALPSEESARIALRTQQVIAHESGVTKTADPLGGSYYLEARTDEIEAGVLAYLKKIEDMGGTLKAIESGYIQREIQESAYRWQLAVDRQDRIVVGVNRFQVEEELNLDILRVDPAVGERQAARLCALRERRDNEAVSIALSHLEVGARNDDGLVSLILDAVEKYATLGEICNVMRSVFGEYQTFTSF